MSLGTEDTMDKGMSGHVAAEDRAALLKKQIEYYFSRENLSHDAYLVSMMDQNMWVDISVILKFQKVVDLCADEEAIISSLKDSKNVIIDESGKRIRPAFEISKSTLILRDIPSDAAVGDVKRLFGPYSAEIVKVKPEVGNTWFVTFKSNAIALKMLERIRGIRWQGEVIGCRLKSEGLLKSNSNPRGPRDSDETPKNLFFPYIHPSQSFHPYSMRAHMQPTPEQIPRGRPPIPTEEIRYRRESQHGGRQYEKKVNYQRGRPQDGEKGNANVRMPSSTYNKEKNSMHDGTDQKRGRERGSDDRRQTDYQSDRQPWGKQSNHNQKPKQPYSKQQIPKIDLETCPKLSDAPTTRREGSRKTFSSVVATNRNPEHHNPAKEKHSDVSDVADVAEKIEKSLHITKKS